VLSLDIDEERIELYRRLTTGDQLDAHGFSAEIDQLYGVALDLAGKLRLTFTPPGDRAA
jgi:hypothetical protein